MDRGSEVFADSVNSHVHVILGYSRAHTPHTVMYIRTFMILTPHSMAKIGTLPYISVNQTSDPIHWVWIDYMHSWHNYRGSTIMCGPSTGSGQRMCLWVAITKHMIWRACAVSLVERGKGKTTCRISYALILVMDNTLFIQRFLYQQTGRNNQSHYNPILYHVQCLK